MVHLAVTVRSTADLAVAVNAEFSSWAVTVARTCGHAEVIDAGFSNDATTADGSTPVLYARQALRTGSRACNYRPLAANDGRRISSKAIWTVAVGFMVADLADGIGATQALDLTRILAAVLRAGFIVLAVAVLPATNLAVTSTEAGFFWGAINVRETWLHTSAVDAFLTSSTVTFTSADETALLIDASIARRTVMVTQAYNRLTTASNSRISPEVCLAFASSSMAFGPTDSVQATLEMVAGVLAHRLTKTVGVASKMTRTVPVPVRTRVGVATALAVWISNEAVRADALVATGHIDALCRRVARVGITVVDLFTPNQGITCVTRAAVTNTLVILSHAASVDSAAIHTRVFAVKVWKAGFGYVAVFVFEALHLFAPFTLVVRVTNVEAIWTCTLGQMVVDNAHSPRCALEELTAILASAFTISFVKLANLVGVGAVSMVNALWLGNLLTASSAVGISSVALSARATTSVVERNAVCIGCAAETDANFSTFHHPNGVGNAGSRSRATSVVATFVVFSFDTAQHVLLVSDEAVLTLAFVRVLSWNAETVWPALVELASVETPLAARVVGPTNVCQPFAVFVNLALVLWPTSIYWVVRIALVVLQTVARWPVVVHPADCIGTTLFLFASVGALTVKAHFMRGAFVVRGAAFSDRLRWQASYAGIVRISLSTRGADALSLVTHTCTVSVWRTLLIDAHRHTFPEVCCIWSTNEIFPAVLVNLAFIRNVAATQQGITDEAWLANTSWSVIHRLANSTLSTTMAFTGIVTIVLAIEYSLADSNGRAIVVSVASLRLGVASGLTVVWVSNKVLATLADGYVILGSANTVLSAQGSGTALKATLDAVAVNGTNLVVPAVTARSTLWNGRAALSKVIGKTFEARPAFTSGLVVYRDAIGIRPTASVPARIGAVPDATTRQQAYVRVGTVVVVLTQVSHASPPQVVGISSKSWETFASCQVIHGNAVCIRPTFIIETKFDAVLDSNRSDFANLIPLAVEVAVATVTRYGRAALREITWIAVVTFSTLADRPVKPANAVRIGAAAGLDASSGAVLDASRIGKAAVALCTIGILETDIEQRLTASDTVVRVSQEGLSADACWNVLLSHTPSVWTASMP